MALTSADRLLAPAIVATLAELNLGPVDSAAVRLAERLALQLDDAMWLEVAADKILKAVLAAGVLADEELDALDALRRKLSARGALSDLGPKLLAVLDDLGATPMSRAKLAKMLPPGKPGTLPGRSALTELQVSLGA